jgi:hypothetical protein
MYTRTEDRRLAAAYTITHVSTIDSSPYAGYTYPVKTTNFVTTMTVIDPCISSMFKQAIPLTNP